MPNRIDGSPSGYLIPGFDFQPTTAAGTEGASTGFSSTREKRPPPFAETPSLGGLGELFGLDRIVPEPSHIGPPPKPLSLEGAPGGGSAAETYMPKLRNAFSAKAGGRPPSVEVQRMMDLLAGHREASSGIRARAGQGGAR